MIDYEFFYNVATYANKNWKGGMSPKEIACNAYEFLISFEESKANGKENATMTSLFERLLDDAYERGNGCQADKWYTQIIREIAGDRPFVKW